MKEIFGIEIDEDDEIFLSDMESIANGIKEGMGIFAKLKRKVKKKK